MSITSTSERQSHGLSHHHVFAKFPICRPMELNGWSLNFLQVRQRIYYDRAVIPNLVSNGGRIDERSDFHQAERLFGENPPPTPRQEPVPFVGNEDALPGINEEYFEWIDVLESVAAAGERFTMIELGAGFGRWSVNAASAVRLSKKIPFQLVCVEAEPKHFGWIKTHMNDNGIDLREQLLIEAAVNESGEPVWFHVGNPSGWYGQCISDTGPGSEPRSLLRRIYDRSRSMVRGDAVESNGVGLKKVNAVTLSEILSRVQFPVDLVDMDIQGTEAKVIAASLELLKSRVKRLHISTHSHPIERELREMLSARGWALKQDYPCLQVNSTPYGPVEFGDGVQSWINLELEM